MEAFVKGSSQVILSPTKGCLIRLGILEDKLGVFQGVTFAMAPLRR